MSPEKQFRRVLPVIQTLIAVSFGGWGEWQRIQILDHSPFGFSSTLVYHVWPWPLKFAQILNTPPLLIGGLFDWPINSLWPAFPEDLQLIPLVLCVPLFWYWLGRWLDFQCNAPNVGRNSRKMIWAVICLFILFSAIGAALSTYGSQLLYGIAAWVVIGAGMAASTIYKRLRSKRATRAGEISPS
jgi:hypothetical protein